MRELVVLMVLVMAAPDDARADQAAVASQPPLTAETVPVTVRRVQSAAGDTGAGIRTATALDAPH